MAPVAVTLLGGFEIVIDLVEQQGGDDQCDRGADDKQNGPHKRRIQQSQAQTEGHFDLGFKIYNF